MVDIHQVREHNKQWDQLVALKLFAEVRDAISPSELLEALDRSEVTGLLACHREGHLDRPSPRRKYSNQPWRCSRCKSWWITVRGYTYDGYGWMWEYAGNDGLQLDKSQVD